MFNLMWVPRFRGPYYLVPDADISSTAGWTGSPFFSKLADRTNLSVVVADDNVVLTPTLHLSLLDPTGFPPGLSTQHVIVVTGRYTGGPPTDVTVELYESVTLIATFVITGFGTSDSQQVYFLTDPEIASIITFSNMQMKIYVHWAGLGSGFTVRLRSAYYAVPTP